MRERGSVHHPRLGPHVRSSIRLAVSALLLIGMAGVVAPSAATTIPAGLGRAQDVPLTVTVPIRMVTAPGRQALNGVIDVRLGDSAAFPVMLDTGSVGLRVFPGAWSSRPGAVTLSSQHLTLPSAGGSMKGLLAKAPLTLGGVTTTRAVAFQYVNTTSPYIGQWAAAGVFGILGVGTSRAILPNPLSALPGGAGQHWSIHLGRPVADRAEALGAIVLGALPPPDAAATLPLPPQGVDVNGALLWNDHKAQGCWTFGRTREQCVDTWLDSGFHLLRAKGTVFARVPRSPDGRVRPGTPVAMAAAGSTFTVWRFVAGPNLSSDVARVTPVGRPAINTGNAIFLDYTVTYDVARGAITLSAPPRFP